MKKLPLFARSPYNPIYSSRLDSAALVSELGEHGSCLCRIVIVISLIAGDLDLGGVTG